ncbi:MAG: hypothetical protein Q8P67_21640, partial [archaeon]|nr:hypothetical protein [archaeon]
LFNRASMCTNPLSSLALFTEAAKVYDLALQHAPNDWEILLNAAECWTKIYVYKMSGGKAMTSVRLDTHHPLAHHIEHYYFRALNAEPCNPYIRHKYARFLMLCKPSRLEKAQHEFLRALEFEPSSTEYLMSYATFLRDELYDMVAADRFDARLYDAMMAQRREEETAQPGRALESLVVPHDVIAKSTEFLSLQSGKESLAERIRSVATPRERLVATQASSDAVWMLRDLLLCVALVPEASTVCRQEDLFSARDMVKLCARESVTPFEAYVLSADPLAGELAARLIALVTQLTEVCFNILTSEQVDASAASLPLRAMIRRAPSKGFIGNRPSLSNPKR